MISLVISALVATASCPPADEAASALLHASSKGSSSDGSVVGAARFDDGPSAKQLSYRHASRCLRYGTPRLVSAITDAGASVSRLHADSPPLAVGNIGGPRGGP